MTSRIVKFSTSKILVHKMSIRLLVHIVIILSITTNSNEEARLKLNNRTSSLISNTQSSASTDRDI